MNIFKRLLTFILCLQLLVSCNSDVKVASPVKIRNSPVPTPQSDEIEIKGAIARSFIFLSEVFLSTALAAEGTISVYDVSSIDSPELLESQEISGSDQFSFKIKKEKVNEKFLKMIFDSKEGSDKSRVFLLIPDGSPQINLELTQETSLKHELMESQIREQISRREIDLAGIKNRFEELQLTQKEDVMYLLGNKELMLKLLSHQELGPIAKEVITHFSLNPDASIWDYRTKLIDLSQRLGGKEPVLNCHGINISLIMPENQKITVLFSALSPELAEAMGREVNLGTYEDFWSANMSLREIMDKFSYYSNDKDLNSAARLWVRSESGVSTSCYVFNQEILDLSLDLGLMLELKNKEFANLDEALESLETATSISYDEFNRKLERAGFPQGSSGYYVIYDDQIHKLKLMHEALSKDFYASLK